MTARSLRLVGLADRIVRCEACPRLVESRRAAGADQPETYWARPVPGFGDPWARIHILGLATAPHGGNRTGRAFTGNASADVLVAALHRAGLANQPTSQSSGDGLALDGTWMASAVRCPPPAHRPTTGERDACLRFLTEELALLPDVRVIVALGALAWQAAAAWAGLRPRPAFGHGVEHGLADGTTLLGCYHPSPQNTRTGRLTPAMLDDVLGRARSVAGIHTVPALDDPA